MSDTETTKLVKVGGQEIEIHSFSTRRSGQVFKAAAALFGAYGDILEDMAAYRRKYGKDHPQTITRAMCEEGIVTAQQRATKPGITTEEAEFYGRVADSYQRMLDGSLKDKDEVQTPGTPADEQVWISVLPKAINEYEEEIARLVGLIVMSDEQFADARKAARSNPQESPPLSDVLLERGDEVIDTTGVDDVINLLIAGAELFLGDMNTRRERVGKLQEVARKALNPATEETASDSTTGSEESSASSTDSPADTDGPKTTSSTDSPSAEPATSPA